MRTIDFLWKTGRDHGISHRTSGVVGEISISFRSQQFWQKEKHWFLYEQDERACAEAFVTSAQTRITSQFSYSHWKFKNSSKKTRSNTALAYHWKIKWELSTIWNLRKSLGKTKYFISELTGKFDRKTERTHTLVTWAQPQITNRISYSFSLETSRNRLKKRP